MTLLLPMEGHGPHELAHAAGFPVAGMILAVLLVLAVSVGFWLWKQGRITVPSLPRRSTPEDAACTILADRFARGDIDGEDFLDRASLLGWTPGAHLLAPSRRRP